MSSNSRLRLDAKLRELLGNSYHLYFQPPENVRMVYPALRYSLASGDTKFANDNPYNFTRRYHLILISKDPDDPMVDILALHFPMCVMDRAYTSDNLYHTSFYLYY